MGGRPEEDSDLFTRARRGEQAAYEEIVQRYQQVAFRTAYMITGSAAEAEEAAQDGFVKAFRALDRFRTGSNPRPWLLSIVANEARNRVRTRLNMGDTWIATGREIAEHYERCENAMASGAVHQGQA